jgi:hypothetical protein
MAVDGQGINVAELTAEWRTANDHVLRLERDEAGASDDPPIVPISATLQPLAASVLADPLCQRAYRFVPTEVGVINLNTVIWVLALPLQPDQPQFQLMQNAPNLYTFVSPSTDFRFLQAELLQPQSVPEFRSTGRPVTILGLGIGYGSNFLNVLHAENRLILGNGSHRAYALRDLGITQIPCLLQRVSRRDELELVASGDFAASPDRYLKSPRPSMLRDYFDPALRKIVPVYRKNRVIRVQFASEQSDIPAQWRVAAT